MSLMYSVRLTVCGDVPGPVSGLRLPAIGNSRSGQVLRRPIESRVLTGGHESVVLSGARLWTPNETLDLVGQPFRDDQLSRSQGLAVMAMRLAGLDGSPKVEPDSWELVLLPDRLPDCADLRGGFLTF